MSEVLIPPWIIPEEEPQEPLDEGSSVFASAFAPGLAQRQSYGGLRLKLSRRHTVRLEEKAQLLSALRSTRGRFNAVRSKVHFALRGSFPATELLTNNTFANGTTGWTAFQSTLTVNDRVLRSTNSGASAAAFGYTRSAISVTQYAPYVLRASVSAAKLATFSARAQLNDGTVTLDSTALSSPGLCTVSLVSLAATVTAVIYNAGGTDAAGNFFDSPYVSLSRCALVDNGLNLLTRSDELDNAAWSLLSGGTIDDNAAAAPDGTTTADGFVENGVTVEHYIGQAATVSASTGDYAWSIALKGSGRTWVSLQLLEVGSASLAKAYFNMSTGAKGTTGISGAGLTNLRSFIEPLGGGIYKCTIVVRKANSATSLRALVVSNAADGGADSIAGISANAFYAWRGTLAQSSVPTRLVQTTSTTSSGTSQTGSALYVKGLPASTSGLLLPEDCFEINGERKTCTAALDSDAAGLGYLQFEPALFRSPADNDPVIILDPMGKFLLSNLKIDNEFGTQANVSYDLEHIYE